MSKTLDELKAKRERYAEWLEQQDVALRKLRSTFLDDERIIEGIIADYKSEISDLDRAIAALSVPEVAEVDGLAEVEIPEGFTKWEGGDCPVAPGTLVKVIHRDGDVLYSVAGDDYAADWTHCDGSGDIIAYRVLPIEPAAKEAGDEIGEAQLASGELQYTDPDAPTAEPISRYVDAPDTITIAASEQHAEESALAQSLPPLFPPEPPQPATPEELMESGAINGEAYGLWRKLAKEPA